MLPQYVDECITSDEAMKLKPGDKVVFIDPREPSRIDSLGRSLNERVLTVRKATRTGIEIEERAGVSLVLRCFHLIKTNPTFMEEDFNAVFA